MIKYIYIFIFLLLSCGGNNESSQSKKNSVKIDPDIQKVNEIIQQKCFDVLDLHNKKHWIKEVGSQNIPSKINIWSKTSENGKGIILGGVEVGSTVIFVEEFNEDYKIATTVNNKLIIGYLSKLQISNRNNYNPVSGKECMTGKKIKAKYNSWLRSTPNGTDNHMRIPRKAEFIVMDEEVTNNDLGNNQIIWYKVEYNGVIGWLSEYNTK